MTYSQLPYPMLVAVTATHVSEEHVRRNRASRPVSVVLTQLDDLEDLEGLVWQLTDQRGDMYYYTTLIHILEDDDEEIIVRPTEITELDVL